MPGDITTEDPGQPGVQQPRDAGRAPPSPQDKALAADQLKRINAAFDRNDFKAARVDFKRARRSLRGYVSSTDDGAESKVRMRTNLHYANLAMVRPSVYAQDPEFTITPTASVPEDKLAAVEAFCKTADAVLKQEFLKGCKVKRRAKRLISSCYATALGYWKLCWQEDRRSDPMIANRLADTQYNLARLQQLRDSLDDQNSRADTERQIAELQQTLAGLQTQAEVVVARGLALDFVQPEDIIIVDSSVVEIADYERAAGIAHRIWMTTEQYQATFGYKPARAKRYRDRSSTDQQPDNGGDLLCVYEFWDRQSNRVFHVCDGVEGFCREPHSPDWTGERWYPFFLLIWNEVDGGLVPPSDVVLTEKLVEEYNKNRDDLVRDREDTLPFTIVRKGGSLTERDVTNVRNRSGADIIMVEGVGGKALSDDLQGVTLGTLNPTNYSTDPARADIEQLIGGGDAARGTVLKAKTATEAEIAAQGLRGRSQERTDALEDMLSDAGLYALQVCLRKMTPEEVQRIAGADASWPTLSVEQIFEMVSVSVRAGSTGKPDRLQDQDRWTKLQPVIQQTMTTVADLYAKGQVKLGQALVAMLRETLSRFDERIDLDQFLPEPPANGQPDPATLMQQMQQMQAQLQDMAKQLAEAKDQIDKGYISAAAQVATSANPVIAGQAFVMAMQTLQAYENGEKTPSPPAQSLGTEPPSGQPNPQPTAALP